MKIKIDAGKLRAGLDFLDSAVYEHIEKCNIMFYGPGDIADRSISSIFSSHEKFRGKIERIYISGREYDEAVASRKAAEHELESRDWGPSAPEIRPISVKHKKIEDFLDDIDLFILTAHMSPHHLDRIQAGKDNLPIIDQIIPVLQGYKGHVHVVTSLPEMLAYKLADESDLNPFQISGCSQVDKNRLDLALYNEFLGKSGDEQRSWKTQAFCIGYHHNPWPVINGLKVNKGSGWVGEKVGERGEVDPGLQNLMAKFVERYAYESVVKLIQKFELNEKPTDRDTGNAVRDFVYGFVFSDLVNASCFRNGLYLEVPTYLDERTARPNVHLMGRMAEKDKEMEAERAKELRGHLNDAGLASEKLDNTKNKEERFEPPDFRGPRIEEAYGGIGGVFTEERLEKGKVEIPSDLEVKLYAYDRTAGGAVKRFVEYDFKSNQAKRFFELDIGKNSGFLDFCVDGERLYAIYETRIKGTKESGYGAVVWDLRNGNLKSHIDLRSERPSSIFPHEEDFYVSFSSGDSAIRRFMENGEEVSYYGLDKVQSVIAVNLTDGLKIYGASGNQLYEWNENSVRKPKRTLETEIPILELRNFNQGISVISGSSSLKEKAVLVDLSSGLGCKSFSSSGGVYDLASDENERVVLASVDPEDGIKIRIYKGLDGIFGTKGETVLRGDDLNLGCEPDVYKLRFVDDLLFITDKNNKQISVVDWKNPQREAFRYSPTGANLLYSYIEKC
ncbi:MAG: hypothetical protein ABIH72_02640 [archaeon]